MGLIPPPLNNVQKKLHYWYRMASLLATLRIIFKLSEKYALHFHCAVQLC